MKHTMAGLPASITNVAKEIKRPFFYPEELLEVMLGDFIPHVSTANVLLRCGGDYDIPYVVRG